jgi:hypothetical protein
VPLSDGGSRAETTAAHRIRQARNRILLIVAVITATVVLATTYTGFEQAVAPNSHFFLDFSNCYCTAAVAKAGYDPYRAEPMGDCVRHLVNSTDRQHEPVIPAATLAGFVIPAFGALTVFDYGRAAFIWFAVLIYTFVALGFLTAKVTHCSFAAAFLALLPLGLIVPIELGQVVSPVVALLLAAALALRRGSHRLAAVFAGLALYEPHIALPVCIAMFTAIPRTRLMLLTFAVAAAIVSVIVLGWPANLEYMTSVIPDQIVAEAAFNDQYSLTYLLTWVGIPISLAILLGKLSYAAVLLLCVFVARSIAVKRLDPALLAIVPMAASVLFGPYLHIEHLLAAVPGALLLATASAPRWRFAAVVLCVAVALPAKTVMQIIGLLPPIHIGGLGPYSALDSSSVIGQVVWQKLASPNTHSLPYLLAKIPTWCALIILVAGFVIIIAKERCTDSMLGGPSLASSAPG